MFGVVRSTVSNVKNAQMGEIHEDFNPPIYNIWNLQKQDNAAPYNAPRTHRNAPGEWEKVIQYISRDYAENTG